MLRLVYLVLLFSLLSLCHRESGLALAGTHTDAQTEAAAAALGTIPSADIADGSPLTWRPRLLLHDAPPITSMPGTESSLEGMQAPAPAPAQLPAQQSTIIDTLVDQKCSMMHHALLAGSKLVPDGSNLQDSELQCCQSCLAAANCTAWVYCPLEAGCTADGALTATQAPQQLAQLGLPHRGCRLLNLPAFELHKNSPQLLATGADVPFTSGTTVSIVLPVLPGYSVRPGTDTAAGLGYKCAESLLLHSCMLQDRVENLAAACDADPQCKAFVYLPNGVDSQSEPIGIFKGGEGLTSLPISMLEPNPSTALYIKASLLTTTGGSAILAAGSSNSDAGRGGSGCRSRQVLTIVLPTVLAALLLLLAAVIAYAAVAGHAQARRQREAAEAAAAAGPTRHDDHALKGGCTRGTAAAAAGLKAGHSSSSSVGSQASGGKPSLPALANLLKAAPPGSWSSSASSRGSPTLTPSGGGGSRSANCTAPLPARGRNGAGQGRVADQWLAAPPSMLSALPV